MGAKVRGDKMSPFFQKSPKLIIFEGFYFRGIIIQLKQL